MGSEVGQLLKMVDEAYNARSWHGTNFRGSIRGISVKQALKRPRAGRHNIREIVLHAAYWKYAVRRRLEGGKRGSFAIAGSNWFSTGTTPDEAQWKKECTLLDREHRLLRQRISHLRPEDLRKKLGHFNVEMTLRGIAAHDLYHAGQIQLIKKLIAGK